MTNEELTVDSLFDDDEVIDATGTEAVPEGTEGAEAVDVPEDVDTEAANAVEVPEGSEGAEGGDGEEGGAAAAELTGIERYLTDFGIVGGQITYEDGEAVNFNDLPADEQYTVLQSLSSDARPSIEEEYDLDESEVQLLNDIRNSDMDVKGFMEAVINEQISKSLLARDMGNVNYDEVPAEAIFLNWLQETNPEITEGEAFEELERQKVNPAVFASQVETLRGQFKQHQDRVNHDREYATNQRALETLEKDRHTIVTAVEDISNIGGAEVTDQMKNEVLHSLLEVNDQGDPLIMEEMFSDPERLFKAAWFMRYGESYLDNVDKYWRRKESEAYKQGKQDVFNNAPDTSNGMSRNDVIPKPGRNNPEGGRVGKPQDVDALWDE